MGPYMGPNPDRAPTRTGPMGPHGPIYGPIRAHMGPNPDRAPTLTGPQPGPGREFHKTKGRQLIHTDEDVAGPGRGGAPSGLGPCPGWGPYGPIWALMGPYMGPYGPIWAHIWAHMGPYAPIYGPIWPLMGPYGPLWVRILSVNFP